MPEVMTDRQFGVKTCEEFMKQIFDDLLQTKLEIPFGNLHAHAYVLQCENGNILIYNTGHPDELDRIAEIGGLQYQILSHRDETGASLKRIKNKFNSKLCCHVKEERFISKSCSVDITFSADITELSGIKILHTPGHTDGSISLFYTSPYGHTYLFTGDTLIQSNGLWETILFSGVGDKTALINSLKIYRNLDPDVVVWSGSGGGETTYAEIARDEWHNIIDEAIEKRTD